MKLFVSASRVQEQSKIITPFTAGQLENCDLLILSDVQSISKDVVGLLKALLGRDPITLQEKFKQEITFINPNCQVIIVSNFPPTHFSEVGLDEGMMNRIIHVEYTDEDRIPQEFQLANLRSYLKDMASDILNWAAHAPTDLFQFHIRNQYYKVYAEIEKNDQALGFEAFLMDEFIYDGTKDAFTSLDDIETKMKTYYENVSDPIFEGVLKARSSKRVIQNNSRCL